jgi:antitoxin component YwqK of YwqJK toxin-antitoxin module
MGMKYGPETYIFSNGERHEMNYVDNKIDGVTTIYYVSGNIQECKYDMGKPLGCEFK